MQWYTWYMYLQASLHFKTIGLYIIPHCAFVMISMTIAWLLKLVWYRCGCPLSTQMQIPGIQYSDLMTLTFDPLALKVRPTTSCNWQLLWTSFLVLPKLYLYFLSFISWFHRWIAICYTCDFFWHFHLKTTPQVTSDMDNLRVNLGLSMSFHC